MTTRLRIWGNFFRLCDTRLKGLLQHEMHFGMNRIAKKLLPVFFCFLWVVTSGQHIVTSLGVERTVGGNQYGASMIYEGKKNWAIGSFFQAGIGKTDDETSLKNPFYGMVLQFPIAKSQKISVVGTIRTGFINNNFFAMAPALETRIKLGRNTGLIFAAGFRMGYPAMSARLFVRLFNE